MFSAIRALVPAAILLLPAAAAAQDVAFEKEIWPILEAKCVQCHRESYQDDGGRTRNPKGGLRLDGAWAIAAGGDSGIVIKPGDSGASEMVFRVSLPPDDADVMPPQGKADPLTPAERRLLATWIDLGADFGGWEGNVSGRPATGESGEPPLPEIQRIYRELSTNLQPLEEDRWKEVIAAGGRVLPLSETSPLLEVDFRLDAESTTDERLASLEPIAEHIAHLDLAETAITDAALAKIERMKHLVRLDLNRTAITDAELERLAKLPHLRYLNLYGTGVSDAGLTHLAGMKSLRAVYLWNSNATPRGAKALAEALPEARINLR